MVRNYKKKTSRAEINEEHVCKAVKAVLDGKASVRTAAAAFSISRSTLHDRLKIVRKRKENSSDPGSDNSLIPQPESSKYAARQIFTRDEEHEIRDYLLKASQIHFGLTYENARKLAFQYARQLGKNYLIQWNETESAGMEWMRGFMKRNPVLSYRKPENTSIARSSAFNKHNVDQFFTNYLEVQSKYQFPPDRIVNTDETGITTVLDAPKVIAQTGKKQVGQCISAERGALVTFCGVISATGVSVPPLYIFPRVRMQDHFLHGSVPGAVRFTAKSGWMTAEIFVKLLLHITNHTSSNPENPILLVMDNHETHTSLAAINFARENGIVLLSFLPHCTHRMQPLDIGVYGPFKAYCKVSFNDYMVSNAGKPIAIGNIAQLSAQPYLQSFTPSNIVRSFQKAGIWPLNRLAFQDLDFDGSYVTDRPEVLRTDENTPSTAASQVNHLMTSSTNFVRGIVEDILQDVLNTRTTTDQPSRSKASERRPSLEEIRPHPKAAPRKTAGKSRCGKSRIYTDSPELQRRLEIDKIKREIEEQKGIKRKAPKEKETECKKKGSEGQKLYEQEDDCEVKSQGFLKVRHGGRHRAK